VSKQESSIELFTAEKLIYVSFTYSHQLAGAVGADESEEHEQ
jgi:hypothetical protein